MDGTLIDSEPYWMAAETALVESFGGTWSTEQAHSLIGASMQHATKVLQSVGVELDEAGVNERLTGEVMHRIVTSGVPFRPGARELLVELREAGIKTALVTMSMRRLARTVVERIDFPAFDLVLGGDDVDKPKPDPEPYFSAARRLGVDIADTVVIEDSVGGVTAAVASGAVSIAAQNIVDVSGLGADVHWHGLGGRTVADIVEAYERVRAA